VQLADVPSRSLDRLLALGHELPVAEGEDVLLQAFVDAMASLVPGYSLAVVVGEGDGRKSFRFEGVVQRTSHTSAPPSREVERSRVFSHHLVERVVRIADSDAVVFVACDDASLAADGAPAVQIAHRALFILEGARQRARMLERIDDLTGALDERDSMLVQSDKLASLGQLAAGMVHEINNPLTSILAYSDFLAKRATAREDTEDVERLRRITESAHRMLRLSRDIVSYARPSTHASQPVVLSAVIDQAFAFCQHLFEESNVTVERSFGDGVLPVRGRPEQLAQVFVNLFTNACHAMPEAGGRVTIVTELSQDEACVRAIVSDNGHGITRENLHQVFLPFFTTKDEKHGTGLGLAIVKRIIEAHEGRVEVDSGADGTRFVISLPVPTE
jgi:signal transduction histidine kinase